MSQADITVLIPCKNNRDFLESFIPQCHWAKEVLVVDSFSNDGSADVARALGARVLQRVYDTSARQKNWALEHVNTEWVFQIDTDEIMEDGLAEEIVKTVAGAPPSIAAFTIRSKNHYGSYWLRHGAMYPNLHKRLFRKNQCRWQDRKVHARLINVADTGTMSKHMLHYGIPSISKQVNNLDRYTSYERDEKLKTDARVGVAKLVYHPPLVFAYRYIWLHGFLDGWRGLVMAMYSAVYDFITIVKVLEAIKSEGGR